MPSSALASFSVHKFHLVSCSAFLETVVSFRIFLTLDYFKLVTYSRLPSHLPSCILCTRVLGRPLWVQWNLSCSTWLWPSWPFSLFAWSHSISPCPFDTVEPGPPADKCPASSRATVWCSGHHSCHPDNSATCLSYSGLKAQPGALVRFSGPSRRKYLHFYTYYYSCQILH